MVNVLKRMRKLKPLLALHSGSGAALLPQNLPASHPFQKTLPKNQPILQSLSLTYPPGNGPASLGARALWRTHLRRLKYHNPSLLITVNQLATNEDKWQLSLTFRGTAAELKKLGVKKTTLTSEDGETTEVEDESVGPIETAPPTSDQTTTTTATTESQSQTRTLSLPTHNRSSSTLWSWLSSHTSALPVPETASDLAEKQSLAEHEVQASIIREALRVELERKRAKEETLRKAKEEASLKGDGEGGEEGDKGGKGGKGKSTRGAGGRIRYSAPL